MMIASFVAMVLNWFELARLLEVRAARLRILQRYGEWLAPVVLIVVGLFLFDQRTKRTRRGSHDYCVIGTSPSESRRASSNQMKTAKLLALSGSGLHRPQ